MTAEIKMNNNCCSSDDIFRLNETKEYVLLSQNILELVLTDTRLTAQTAKLWQLLYSKAKFNNDLGFTISYSYLAKILNKSIRTIARYIANLEECGYLQIQPNFGTNGSRLENTLFVRIPEMTLNTLNATKDRKITTKNPDYCAPPTKLSVKLMTILT